MKTSLPANLPSPNGLRPEDFEAIRRLDTCTVANAIETFEIRLRNEGFADATVRCLFPHLNPMLGYAATAKIRCSGLPPDGRPYLERTDWWNHILSVPAPRVVVLQDIDRKPGSGALLGEVHANILSVLECAGAVTNGAVRDLPAVASMGFHFFARNVAVSHSYAHIVEVGVPIEIGGLRIQPGDLIHGDGHGVVSVPSQIAADLPAAAARLAEKERKLIGLCRAPDFSLEKLRRAVRERA
jgi:4-hydroxy-4-methyl-2-oxoglutarate aldolase